MRAENALEQRANGLAYVPLSNAGRFFNLQPMLVRIPLSRRGNEHYHHDGEEWIYVLSGALTLSLAGKAYDLERGDAAHFDSRLQHRLIARGSRDAEVLVIASPLSGSLPITIPGIRQHRAIPAMGLADFKCRNALSALSTRNRASYKLTRRTAAKSQTPHGD